jgi:putative ABC transport system permease protein
MILFLLKGLLRDRSRSLFPVLIVLAGVMLTGVLYSWVNGVKDEVIQANANFSTGHVKVMTQAYSEQADQIPNDLALIGVDSLLDVLRKNYVQYNWQARIKFGGLLDIPDAAGETRAQGTVLGMAVDLLNPKSIEPGILHLEKSIVRGRLPEKLGEILISDEFAQKLDIHIGDTVTLISSTMYGEMTMHNFVIAGTVRFGISALDRGAMIADLADIQTALDMQDAAGEIFGFFKNNIYDQQAATATTQRFNSSDSGPRGEFSPIMITLGEQNDLASALSIYESFAGILISIFVFVMSIVLWNAGLMGSIRRYGEIGVRLAIGESKGHVYRSMLVESFLIALIGSSMGTVIGLFISYYLQVKGIDISTIMQNSTLIMVNVIRAHVTKSSYFIGFVPGLLASLLGTIISGIGIYKRETASLFKELEV